MKTLRIGSTLGFLALALSACGNSSPSGSLDARDDVRGPTSQDASAPRGDIGAGVDPDGGLSDASITDTNTTPPAEYDANYAADFDRVAACASQPVGAAVRFRAAGASVRVSDGTAAARDDASGCVPVGPAGFDDTSTNGFVNPGSFGFAAAPVVYVRAAESPRPDADGTAAHPYVTLGEALAHVPPARTVVLAAGTYALPATTPAGGQVVTSELSILGHGAAGSEATIVTTDAGSTAFALDSAGASLSLAGLTVRATAPGAPAASRPLVSASNGAALFASYVLFEGGSDGVRVAGAGTEATFEHVSFQGAVTTSVRVLDGAAAVLRQSHVASGALAGLLVESASLSAVETAVLNSTGEGLVFTGAPARPGLVDRLDRIVIRDSVGVGLRIDGEDRRVSASLIEVSGVRVRGGGGGVAGVYVANGELNVDDGFTRVDDGALDENCGKGSLIAGNFGIGLLASGANARMLLSGARVEHNGGPGVVVQDSASAPRLQLLDVSQNLGFGMLVANRASILALLDDTVHDTLTSTVALLDDTVIPAQLEVVLADISLAGGGRVALLDDTVRGARGGYVALALNTALEVKALTLGPAEALFGSNRSGTIGNSAGQVSLLDDTVIPSILSGRTAIGVLRSPGRFVSR